MKTKNFKYQYEPHPNSSINIILENIGRNQKVLDVGCAAGILGRRLVGKNCLIVGVEMDEEMAKVAEKYYTKVIVGNAKEIDLDYPKGYFDVIVFADILEHFRDPEKVLKKYEKYLSPEGKVIISLPNVAIWFMRLNLLLGRFNYTDTGILDKDHLKFFTLKSAKEFVINAEYEIVSIRYAGRLIGMLKIFPSLFAYQFVFILRKRNDKTKGTDS